MNKINLDLQKLDRFQGPGNNPFWHGLLIPAASVFPTISGSSFLFLTVFGSLEVAADIAI